MSAKIMGQVWDYVLRPNEQAVLLAFADHADHNGENAFPSVGLVCWKTNLSKSTVKRVLRGFRARGVLVEQRKSQFHYSTCYRIVLQSLVRKGERGVTLTPLKGGQIDRMGGQIDPKRGHSSDPLTVLRNHPIEPASEKTAKTRSEAVAEIATWPAKRAEAARKAAEWIQRGEA